MATSKTADNPKRPSEKNTKKIRSRGSVRPYAEKAKTSRLGFRVSEPQAQIIRMASDISHKSLTDFIMDSAYQAAEKMILDQRLFMVSDAIYQTFSDMLERPTQENEGLNNLFSSPAPWDADDLKKT